MVSQVRNRTGSTVYDPGRQPSESRQNRTPTYPCTVPSSVRHPLILGGTCSKFKRGSYRLRISGRKFKIEMIRSRHTGTVQ